MFEKTDNDSEDTLKIKEELKKFYEYLKQREAKLLEKIEALAKNSINPFIPAQKTIEQLIYEEKDTVLKDWYKNPKNGRIAFTAMRQIIKTSWAKQMTSSYKKALEHRFQG